MAMLYAAMNGDSSKVMATPKGRALCPTCGQSVIAKCGDIKVWHWAHLSADCDTWAEGETPWHLAWKRRFENVEVTIRRDGEWHRADAMTGSGWVIEFQRSPIAPAEIEVREKFYRKMIWVFDATESRSPKRVGIPGTDSYVDDYRLLLYPSASRWASDNYVTFRWKHARRSVGHANATTYLDLGDGWLLKVGKIYFDGVCAGWGHLVDYETFEAIGAEL